MRKNKVGKKIEKLTRKNTEFQDGNQALDVSEQFGTEVAEIDILTRIR